MRECDNVTIECERKRERKREREGGGEEEMEGDRYDKRCIRELWQQSARPAQMHTRSHGCPHTEIRIASGTLMRIYASFGFLTACVVQTRFCLPMHLCPTRVRIAYQKPIINRNVRY